MGERKVVNKYFPPDFNPSKISRKRIGKKKEPKVRTMIPMNMRCNLCGNHIRTGTKFNVRKEEAIDKKYLGEIKVFRFYFKCPVCCAEITVLTDPKNDDYVVESGARRNLEPWREEDGEAEEFEDSMKSLENRTRDSKREMDRLAALDELRSIKSRHSKISVDSLLNNLHPKGEEAEEEEEEDKLSAEDEAIIKSRFRGEFVRRINDDEYDCDDDKSPRNNNLKKRKVVCGEFTTSNPRTYGTHTHSGVVSITNTFRVEKKPPSSNMKDNRQGKSNNNALECLFQDYGSDG